MKLLLKSAVIAFSAIGIVLSSHTISYAADSSTANIANAPDITSGNSATTDNDTAHNIGITVSVNNNGSVSDYTKNLTDGSYDTTINLVPNATVNVKADENIYGLYIIWSSEVTNYTITYNSQTVKCGENGFLHDYMDIKDGSRDITINVPEGMQISDIYAYSRGNLPDNVQRWEAPLYGMTDILVFSTHADDEILFLGGVLTNYGGEQNLNVQIAYMCDFFLTEPVRQHEELDGLWECGIKNYPVKGTFEDLYSLSLEKAKSQYVYDDIISYSTECIRKFKPLVCVSQDFNGEYGHGGHRIYAAAIQEALEASNNADMYPDSASKYGLWDVPKVYYHLYGDNTITLDVDTPLYKLGGRTSVQVLQDAFKKHVSQISYSFNMLDSGYAITFNGQFDTRSFGLYRTLVGLDTTNNMLENVTPYKEQAATKTDEPIDVEFGVDQEDTADNAANTKPDIKQSAVTIIAIIIIGVVIIAQAYRTRNLYKKKYDANKDEFENKQ